MISADHLKMLAASGISEEYALARGYETVDDRRRLAELKITQAGRNVPGLLVPMLRADGSVWGYQYRSDKPRMNGDGKSIKYETPYQQRNGLDIPRGVGPMLGDPAIPLFITEGTKKADAGASHGLCIVSLSGVWNWRRTNNQGGKTALPEWNDIALNGRRVIIAYDGDIARNDNVQKASRCLAEYLATKGAKPEYLHLPDTDQKTGLDTVEQLWKLVKPVQPTPREQREEPPAEPKPDPKPVAAPMSLGDAHKVFRHWLGEDYDTDALDVMLATVAVEKFGDGSDLVWLLIISGPGNAKTETAQALDGIGATITSVISSEAALLSATPQRERTNDATGGLLRKIGDRGVLVIKDVTSVLSMNRDLRARVLAALREVYDGRWCREVGTDGGHTIEWRGRIAVVGAVTTAWDSCHSVVATMGDRFVLVRIDSTRHREAAGRRAIGNTGDEQQMRRELAAAVAGVIAGMNAEPITITETETDALIAAANLVTLARTGVEFDYRGDVIDAHAPEMPTRFAKQLAQIVRGGVAVGMDRADALRLAIRCARDSMPLLRLAIIDNVAVHPHSSTQEVRRSIDKPRKTVDRQLQALHMLGVLTCDEVEYAADKCRWYYSLAANIDPDVLNPQSWPDLSPHTPSPIEESEREESEREQSSGIATDKSGQLQPDDPCPPVIPHTSAMAAMAATSQVRDPLSRRQPDDSSPNGQHAKPSAFVPPSGPGRCPACGWHIDTMGHESSCRWGVAMTYIPTGLPVAKAEEK
jgi:hypothetical protein